MLEVRQTSIYSAWFDAIRDRQAKVRIDIRIRRLSLGNAGDGKPVGEGVSELRVNFGPGYRVYFVQRREECIILLAGGDKTSLSDDICQAKVLASNL